MRKLTIKGSIEDLQKALKEHAQENGSENLRIEIQVDAVGMINHYSGEILADIENGDDAAQVAELLHV
jgi:hypothetical protein